MASLPPLGLYIHLPWCERKCPYCDFNSHETQTLPETEYIAALIEDLRHDRAYLEGREISSVFIGGGTPSLFSAPAIGELLRHVRDTVPLDDDAEITLEANPGSAETEKFAGFYQAGVNRLSVGVQSLNDDQLQALGRIHNAEQAHRALAAVRDAGFSNFNIDLMHGLPGQSVEAALQDLEQALGYKPSHLSWYQLTIEPNTQFAHRPPTLPEEDTLAAIAEEGLALIETSGLVQYEVSAYAAPEKKSQHNLNYWRFGDYLGIGAGAHSKVTTRKGQVIRYARTRQPTGYLQQEAAQRITQRRQLENEDLIGEFMLNALRLSDGFATDLFSQRTGLDASVITRTIDNLCDRELLTRDAGTIRTTRLGARFLDSVVGEFFSG